jgi:hypothetical protein
MDCGWWDYLVQACGELIHLRRSTFSDHSANLNAICNFLFVDTALQGFPDVILQAWPAVCGNRSPDRD